MSTTLEGSTVSKPAAHTAEAREDVRPHYRALRTFHAITSVRRRWARYIAGDRSHQIIQPANGGAPTPFTTTEAPWSALAIADSYGSGPVVSDLWDEDPPDLADLATARTALDISDAQLRLMVDTGQLHTLRGANRHVYLIAAQVEALTTRTLDARRAWAAIRDQLPPLIRPTDLDPGLFVPDPPIVLTSKRDRHTTAAGIAHARDWATFHGARETSNGLEFILTVTGRTATARRGATVTRTIPIAGLPGYIRGLAWRHRDLRPVAYRGYDLGLPVVA